LRQNTNHKNKIKCNINIEIKQIITFHKAQMGTDCPPLFWVSEKTTFFIQQSVY